MTFKCSICGNQTGRKDNAKRHLRLVHSGSGEVIDLNTGQSYRTLPGKVPRVLKRVLSIHNEEYIREMARLRAREDYKNSDDDLATRLDDYKHALVGILLAASHRPISISEVINKFTESAVYIEAEEGEEKTTRLPREPTLKEQLGLEE